MNHGVFEGTNRALAWTDTGAACAASEGDFFWKGAGDE